MVVSERTGDESNDVGDDDLGFQLAGRDGEQTDGIGTEAGAAHHVFRYEPRVARYKIVLNGDLCDDNGSGLRYKPMMWSAMAARCVANKRSALRALR